MNKKQARGVGSVFGGIQGNMRLTGKAYNIGIGYPVKTADSFMTRFLGLMGKKNVDYGLLLVPCQSIHTFFMKIPIDAVYLNDSFTVIDIQRDLKPWKIGKYLRNAHSILELPAGLADSLHLLIGKQI